MTLKLLLHSEIDSQTLDFLNIDNNFGKNKVTLEHFSGKEEERQMFQQMQAMAQKQVIIGCPVLHVSLVISLISKVLSHANINIMFPLLRTLLKLILFLHYN